MSLTGVWKNNYGSTMTLEQYPSGLVGGTYKSSTGSTGVYNVIGFADTTEPTTNAGQPTALSIYWRSIAGGPSDPSWHWVSGLSGQLSLDTNGSKTIVLMHGLVATDPFPQLAGIGTYLDKLIYTPTSGSLASGKGPDPQDYEQKKTSPEAAYPIEGDWVCLQDKSITLSVSVISPPEGYVSSSLTVGGNKFGLIGFADTYAQQDGLNLQALSISGYNSATKETVSLSGSLNFQTGILALTNLTSESEAPGNIYLQTTTQGWYFTRM